MEYAKEGDLGEGSDCLKFHPDPIHQNTTTGSLGSWKGTDKVDMVCLSPPCPPFSQDACFPGPTGHPEGGGTPIKVLQDR